MINDFSYKILPVQKENSRKTAHGNNLFIKNLDSQVDSALLFEIFSKFGNITTCKVALDDYGASRGYGSVQYDSNESADQAIAAMNGSTVHDRVISVVHHIPKKDRYLRLEELKTNFKSLYVKNIDLATSEQEFKELFEKHGTLLSYSFPLNEQGQSRGFGFANYQSHESAANAIEALNGLEIRGKNLYVSRAQKKYERDGSGGAINLPDFYRYGGGSNDSILGDRLVSSSPSSSSKYQGSNLYVKYLDSSIDDNGLRDAFSPFGTITSAKIMTDDNGVSRGFGFVCFSNEQEAQAAIVGMHQTSLLGKALYVSRAQRKDSHHRNVSPFLQSQAAFPYNGPIHLRQPMAPGQYVAAPPYYYTFGPPHPSFLPPHIPITAPLPTDDYRQGSGTAGYIIGGNKPQSPDHESNGSNSSGNGNSRYTSSNGSRQRNSHVNGNNSSSYRKTKNGNNHYHHHKDNQQLSYGSSLSAAVASAANPEAEKQVIGEALYPKVLKYGPVSGDNKLAAKITGMLLEQNNDELLKWIDDDRLLNNSIQQAYDAYMEFLLQQTK